VVYGVDQACQMTVMVDAKAELFTVRFTACRCRTTSSLCPWTSLDCQF